MALVQFDEAALKSMMDNAFNQQAREYYHSLPAPDPLYTADEVAKLLKIDVSTVRSYMKLPVEDKRHLPYVRCTDTAWGYRIPLSSIEEWKKRHRSHTEVTKVTAEPQMEVTYRFPDRRKRGHGNGRKAA
ncbi:helix-turn-helix domain-containing protein [Hymenobacter sp. 102]|uniref:helix-turn-helix domain-containing protein n=1 Tax=Hymenobacter sp. 102 TaxID=3403152 RepID=UPI003CEC1B8D